jgi:hypothetical protein
MFVRSPRISKGYGPADDCTLLPFAPGKLLKSSRDKIRAMKLIQRQTALVVLHERKDLATVASEFPEGRCSNAGTFCRGDCVPAPEFWQRSTPDSRVA